MRNSHILSRRSLLVSTISLFIYGLCYLLENAIAKNLGTLPPIENLISHKPQNLLNLDFADQSSKDLFDHHVIKHSRNTLGRIYGSYTHFLLTMIFLHIGVSILTKMSNYLIWQYKQPKKLTNKRSYEYSHTMKCTQATDSKSILAGIKKLGVYILLLVLQYSLCYCLYEVISITFVAYIQQDFFAGIRSQSSSARKQFEALHDHSLAKHVFSYGVGEGPLQSALSQSNEYFNKQGDNPLEMKSIIPFEDFSKSLYDGIFPALLRQHMSKNKRILDTSGQPDLIEILGSLSNLQASSLSLSSDGNKAVISTTTDVITIDISDFTSPILGEKIAIPSDLSFCDVYLTSPDAQTFLYTYLGQTFIMDLSNPQSIIQLEFEHEE